MGLGLSAFYFSLSSFILIALLPSPGLCEISHKNNLEEKYVETFKKYYYNETKGVEDEDFTEAQEDIRRLFSNGTGTNFQGRGLLSPKFKANSLIDKLLELLRMAITNLGLDKIQVDNLKIPILTPPIVISGHIDGVATIQRDGDFSVELGLTSSFNAGLKIGVLNGLLMLTSNGTTTKLNVTIENVSIKAQLDLALLRLPPTFQMSELKISAGKLKGDFDNLGLGLGLLDKGTTLGVAAVDKLKDPLLQVISMGIKTLINTALKGLSKLPMLAFG